MAPEASSERSRSSRWRTASISVSNFAHLLVEVFQRDLQGGQPVVGLTMCRLDGFDPLQLGEIACPVLDPTALRVELSQLEQRTLLVYFSFHHSFSRHSRGQYEPLTPARVVRHRTGRV